MAQHKVYIQRKFSCPPNALFKWLIQPVLIAKWFGPKHLSVGAVFTDVQVGGKYAIELQGPDNPTFSIEGEYLEIFEPSKLTFSLRYKGLSVLPPESEVRIVIQAISASESQLSLIQQFATLPSNMPERTKAWEHMLQELAKEISAL